MRPRLLFLTTSLALVPLLGSCNVEKSDLNTKKISKSVAYSLPVFHLNQLPLDENISTNAFQLYLESLDPARSYFLQSDIDGFEKEAAGLAKQLRKGDISFALRVYDVLMERIENRIAFTEALLDTGFDTSSDEIFLWDRTEAEWARTEEEWNELWRKRVKNEYISRLVSQQVFFDEEDASTNTVDEPVTAPISIPSPSMAFTTKAGLLWRSLTPTSTWVCSTGAS